MTTLRKIISEIDKTNKALTINPNWEGLSSEFGINDLYWSDDTRLKAYFIRRHYCTDTWVGARVYFLDDEVVAISIQPARKAREEFSFVDIESCRKLRNYLLSLVHIEETLPNDFIEDWDKEIAETYKVQYNTQILQKTGFFEGKEVKIIKTNFDWQKEKEDHFHSVIIEDGDGEERKIDCRELDFKYNT
jgi:hypothetical protein